MTPQDPSKIKQALRAIYILGFSLFVWGTYTQAQTTIVDGDTLKIASTTYRLNGIDAPESNQSCRDSQGKQWACGNAATKALNRLVRWRSVQCNPVTQDTYGRTVATCYAGGKDLGAELVKSGLAWAYRYYSTEYVAEEEQAKAQHLGIWQANNMPAWDFRRSSTTTTQSNSSGDPSCVIKGNISNSGRIYHTPNSPWYSRTKIDTSNGERWFCSEAEARAAGWRAPR